ncbi:MAG: carbohydrate ABC transporter permease [Bacillota bacterium]
MRSKALVLGQVRVSTSARGLRSRSAQVWSAALVYGFLVISAILMALPFVWMVASGFKSYTEIFVDPFRLVPRHWTWSNFREVFQVAPFHLYVLNTVKVSLLSTFGAVATSAMGAYAFARLRFPGRDYLFMGYLATLMIPGQVTLVPRFILMKWFGLLDNHLSLVLPGMFTAYGTFLLRQFFVTIPRELEEAAAIDGAGYLRRFVSVILPQAKPALATLAVFTLMWHWNDYLHPLVFINSESKRTLALGLAIFRGDVDVQWNLVMAGVTISVFPLVIAFLAAQRFFVEGIALTGLKG